MLLHKENTNINPELFTEHRFLFLFDENDPLDLAGTAVTADDEAVAVDGEAPTQDLEGTIASINEQELDEESRQRILELKEEFAQATSELEREILQRQLLSIIWTARADANFETYIDQHFPDGIRFEREEIVNPNTVDINSPFLYQDQTVELPSGRSIQMNANEIYVLFRNARENNLVPNETNTPNQEPLIEDNHISGLGLLSLYENNQHLRFNFQEGIWQSPRRNVSRLQQIGTQRWNESAYLDFGPNLSDVLNSYQNRDIQQIDYEDNLVTQLQHDILGIYPTNPFSTTMLAPETIDYISNMHGMMYFDNNNPTIQIETSEENEINTTDLARIIINETNNLREADTFLPIANAESLSYIAQILSQDVHHPLANLLSHSTLWRRGDLLIYRDHEEDKTGLIRITDNNLELIEDSRSILNDPEIISHLPEEYQGIIQELARTQGNMRNMASLENLRNFVNSSEVSNSLSEEALIAFLLTSHLDTEEVMEDTQETINEIDETTSPDRITEDISINNFAGFAGGMSLIGESSPNANETEGEYFELDKNSTNGCRNSLRRIIRGNLGVEHLNSTTNPPLTESQIEIELDHIADLITEMVLDQAMLRDRHEDTIFFKAYLSGANLDDAVVRIETNETDDYRESLNEATHAAMENINPSFLRNILDEDEIVNQLGTNGVMPENVNSGRILAAEVSRRVGNFLRGMGGFGATIASFLGLREADENYDIPEGFNADHDPLETDPDIYLCDLPNNFRPSSDNLPNYISSRPRERYEFRDQVETEDETVVIFTRGSVVNLGEILDRNPDLELSDRDGNTISSASHRELEQLDRNIFIEGPFWIPDQFNFEGRMLYVEKESIERSGERTSV